MAKLLKRFALFTLGALSLTSLILAIISYKRIVEKDLSIDGTNWACIHVRDGAVLIAFVDADAAPGLGIIKASPAYKSFIASYSIQTLFFQQQMPAITSQAFNDVEATVGHTIRGMREEHATKLKQFAKEALAKARASWMYVLDDVSRSKSFAGFFLHTEGPPREVVLRIPLAAFVLLFGLIPALSFASWLRTRARRKRENLCLHCGYCLTGNTSGTCPECGTKIAMS